MKKTIIILTMLLAAIAVNLPARQGFKL